MQTEAEIQDRVVKSTAVQYIHALTRLKESLPPFSEQRRAVNEHILAIHEFQRTMARDF